MRSAKFELDDFQVKYKKGWEEMGLTQLKGGIKQLST